jgi:hypothetical protein
VRSAPGCQGTGIADEETEHYGRERVAGRRGLPLTGFRYGMSTSVRDGVRLADDEQDRLTLQVRVVTPDYFSTMRIPVVRGRAFTSADRRGSETVAVGGGRVREQVFC